MVLGFSHPDRLLERLTAAEMDEWAAYFGEEPFGPEAESLRAAIVACTVANASRSSKQTPYKVTDFQLGYKPPPLEQKVHAVMAQFMRKQDG